MNHLNKKSKTIQIRQMLSFVTNLPLESFISIFDGVNIAPNVLKVLTLFLLLYKNLAYRHKLQIYLKMHQNCGYVFCAH